MPYLTKKVNNYQSLSGKSNHNVSNDSSSTSYDMKNLRISAETNEHMDISVESGSSFSENDSLESPINFNTNSTASTANLNNPNAVISNSYPQQNSFINSSSFEGNRFELNISSSLTTTKKLHRSTMNIASSESKIPNPEVMINRQAMIQQHQQQQQKKQKHLQQTATNGGSNLMAELEPRGSSTNSMGAPNNDLKKSAGIAEDTEEEDELSIEDNFLNEMSMEENRIEMLKQLGLSKAECECILNIPASNNFDDLRLFVRLCPYFNGRHHLEDIMYYANVRRSALLALIDKFRDVLYTAQYEDEAVSHLCGYNFD